MKIRCKRNWLLFALFLGAVFFTSKTFAQVTIGTVDGGPYTPGSTIAVPFNVGTNCINPGNQFQLYLSDQNGSFASETLIGSYSGFYSTYVNGIIPAGTIPGTGYKVRVKTTNPASVSNGSASFEVKAGSAIEAKVTSNYLNPNNTETFGTCISRDNNQFFLNNESTANSNVTATVTDELNGGSPANISFSTPIQSFTAQYAHYTIFVKAIMPNGTVATKAYLLVNNKIVTAFGTSGNNIVCLPLGMLTFNVDIVSPAGIQYNFPGDSYTITWGDQTTSVYSLCDIKKSGGTVSHSYIRSSCGSVSTTSAGTIYNAFPVTINLSNSFCGTIGTPISSSAKVVVKPINAFSFNSPGCTNTDITFANTSVLGEDPNTNTPECKPNTVTYNWFVDGAAVAVNKPISYSLVYKFPTHGKHIIRLESTSSGACPADPVEMEICIQDPPKPAFSLPTNTICSNSTLKAADLSVLDNICEAANVYSWNVSPAVNYVNGTNAASKEPEFSFANAGVYTITLSITTPSCGIVTTAPQTVVVNASPVATLSPDFTLCNLATYDFNNTTTGPTKTTISGTSQDQADTYTWTVSAAAGGTYSFTGGTTANSKYPSIKFDNYDSYTVTIVHKNNCGTATSSQKLTFTTAPVVNAGPDQSICFNESSFTLNATITGSVNSQTWIGGAGTFSPGRGVLNAVYTPTAAEKASGLVTLQLRATTTLGTPCNEINDDVILRIKENISLNSASSKNICTGTNVSYTPSSSVAGVTYNWTAAGTPGAAGYSPSGSGAINDVITNSDPVNNVTVTYTIVPEKDGCQGTPFTLVVTVSPNPVMTATPAALTICDNTSSAITLASNINAVNYSYTSTVTGLITGNSQMASPTSVNTVNDILLNSSATTGTVTYVFTPVSSAGCPGNPVSVTITVQPRATLPAAGPDESVCNASTYTLKGNTPIVGSGKWSVVSASNTVNFANDTQANTVVSGLQPGNSYVFKWTISDASCSTASDDVQITVNPLSVGGSTSGDATVCSGSNGGSITLAGQVGDIIRWERSIDNGITWSTITSTANPLVYSGLTVTTQYRAIVQSGACIEAASTATTITVNPGTVVSNAGPNQSLCSGNGITLNGNNPAPNTGIWTLTSGQTGIVITNPSLNNTTVTGLTPGSTYTFRWTINGFAGCPPSSSETSITYFPPVTNNISVSSSPVCAGQSVSILGEVPTGGAGSFSYQWQSSADGNTWVNITSATGKDLTIVASLSAYYRRLVNSTICTSVSNSVQVNILPTLSNNTISADQQICQGSAAAALTGSTPSGGNGTYNYQWQSSLDAVSWSDVLGATIINYTPPVPTSTIYYRRNVSSGSCSGTTSNQVKLTVNPPAKAEITFLTDKACAPFQLSANNVAATLYPDRNATYTWYADNVQIGVQAVFPGYTINEPNRTVVIKLVVTSSLGCSTAETSHTFSTYQDVLPSFTQSATQGCGPLNVTFTNTSTSLTDATFAWNFGNGTTSTAPQPPAVTFQPDPTGKDITYTVTLTATTPCGPSTFTSTVMVKASPVSRFSPDKTTGCSALLVNFSNTGPESTGTTYTYDFGDGTNPETFNDRRTVPHTFQTLVVKDFVVRMTAKNDCGEQTTSNTIRVSPNNIVPELVVNGNEKIGCAPHTVNFVNNTSGASSFVYTFTNEDTGEVNTAFSTAAGVYPYTFTKPGRYTIRLDAENDCSKNTTTETVTVRAQPTAAFSADKTSGCTNLLVKFKNTSVGAVGYLWDFGDGSTPSTQFEPEHTYAGTGVNYTVKLTTTNTLGCTNTTTISNFISIVSPPVAAFTVSPGNELSIPNYTFGFKDVSMNAVSWEWTFGDGASSTLQNPNHTYAENGTYTVTLKTLNKEGCSSATTQSVRIIGVPGNLSVPNSFMPASAKNEIRTFKAKGRGIASWTMSVFNKWGQLLWETTKLDDGAPLEGWDGTYNGQEQPQGVYYWKIDVKFINGSDWKGMTFDSSPPRKTGVIYLIR
ncbi:PKD domain-containing protein [Pedobacter sp. BMA]|uniref:PKD domain-containing protein n=1 Tax=Pedobacter sp. BMA TaxID=1663685 RepID=UPI0009E577DF|nr:PKD domain-containing protein [Pedobacter sp. BMA]